MKIVNEEQSNNKILTAIAIASLFIGSSKIMAIETYSENSFGVSRTDARSQTARGIVVDQEWRSLSSEQVSWKKVLPMELPPTYTVNSR